jgi:hypothetical protein
MAHCNSSRCTSSSRDDGETRLCECPCAICAGGSSERPVRSPGDVAAHSGNGGAGQGSRTLVNLGIAALVLGAVYLGWRYVKAASDDDQAEKARSAAIASGPVGAPSGPASALARPVVIASGLRNPTDIVLDATHLYFTEEEDPNDAMRLTAIKRVLLHGGSIETLAVHQRNALGLAVTPTGVLWLAAGDYDKGEQGFVRALTIVPGKLAEPSTLARTSVGSWTPLVVRGEVAVWPDADAIYKIAWKGGTRTKVSSADHADSANALTLDDSFVYWVQLNKLMRAPLAGNAPPVLLAEVGSSVYGLAVDASHVYFTDKAGGLGEGAMRRVPKTGGAVETLARHQALPWGIATDERSVYWVNNDDKQGAVMRFRKPAGPVEVVAGGQDAPIHVVLDAAHIYWNCAGSGSILSVPK